jgi:hypothetical protein
MSAGQDSTRPQPSGHQPAARPAEPVVKWLRDGGLAAPNWPRGLSQSRPVPLFRRHRSWLLLLAAVALGLALGQGSLHRLLLQVGPVPEQFLGSWSTNSHRYADRGFVISRDSLRLRLGAGASAVYPVEGVRQTQAVNGVTYTFLYRDGLSLLELSLQMNPHATVHIANLPSVDWKRTSR